MKTKMMGFPSRLLFVPVSLAVGALLWGGMGIYAAQAAEDTYTEDTKTEGTKKVEIVIKDGTAQMTRGSEYAITGIPTEIVVRNEDTKAHGFNSSLFGRGVTVEAMMGGYIAEGRGPNVYRVAPGKTMVLRVTPSSRDMGSTTSSFWCDMHSSVKGEMLVLDLSGPGGG